MTKNELIAKCEKENPKMFQTINDEVFELTGTEYEKACENWAEYQLYVQELEVKAKEIQSKRALILEKLGITAEEAVLLLS